MKEKHKLLEKEGFVILEYIRSSIEIIMSLKIEDLERDNANNYHKRSILPTVEGSQSMSVSSSMIGAGIIRKMTP